MSLGVDLIPYKTCSLNCVYCESGATTHLTTNLEAWYPTQEIIAEIDHYLSQKPTLDIITFSGAGEPTLHSGLGEIARHIKRKYPEYPLAVITNATTMAIAEVRESLLACNILLPSLDAATQKVFRKVNRPAPGIDIRDIIEGLKIFQKDFSGEMWLEVFLVKGINDTQDELTRLHEVIADIQPDRVQLNTLDRPGTEDWVRPMSENEMRAIADSWSDLPVEIIARFSLFIEQKDASVDLRDRIINLIRRRPCTSADLSASLQVAEKYLLPELKKLIQNSEIESEVLERGTFYKISGS